MGKDMASTDAPFGFQPYEKLMGAHWYSVVTSNAVAMYIGDCVEMVGTAIVTARRGVLQAVITEETGATGTIMGAVIALEDHNGDPVSYLPVTTVGDSAVAGYALVADHPDQVFIAQEDGDTSSLVVANIGLNVDGISTVAGSTSTGISGMELDSNTVNTTATLAWKIVGVHPDDTISSAGAAGNHARFLVMNNAAQRGVNIAGV